MPLSRHQQRVDEWNAQHRVGSEVLVQTFGDYVPQRTKTTSQARLIQGDLPAVGVEGRGHYVALDCVRPVEEAAKQPTPFEAAGMAWWNSLSEPERFAALEAVGRNASVADAYRHHLTGSSSLSSDFRPPTSGAQR